MSKKVVLKHGKSASLSRRHPWIFSGAIAKKDKGVRDGDRVEVRNEKGTFLATGHYQDGGSIAIRIISFNPIIDIQDFWNKMISDAWQYRKRVGIGNNDITNCFRLVHAEGDGLPGLIIDIYDKVAVVQCHSIGMYKDLYKIAHALRQIEELRIRSIYSKSQATLPSIFAQNVVDEYLDNLEALCPAIVKENGVLFEVNWESGQKTGFFLDQRDNRSVMAKFAGGKKILNAFSYSGGFSVYALLAGALEVHSVDVSELATTLADRNVEINGLTDNQIHKSITADVMDYLKSTQEIYDIIIVDPPAFAKSIKKKHNAVQAYKRLNILALKKLKPGGILGTFSCSQVVDKPLFYNTIKAAAMEIGRSVRVIQHLSQPADHPVSLYHDQSSYLKGLVLYVDWRLLCCETIRSKAPLCKIVQTLPSLSDRSRCSLSDLLMRG